ncbi:hypothetical protein [Mycoplasma zalophidermidis]|uniref:Uncharacterized protein n=1 Tax=Mycoplasma zalophidermidis TaxID=398174 RepID=A0ABS6DQV6_9MOLU|nr:hypothetical protein [Mycoplasma zalophidermidis]MBU4689507.1 hypothetical protein [Mycoplasma zalophidermidis]MBU4693385.1 hypothetical protein [Mycoplasma zalophidermidis]MCR8966317.1 hypothetical protein [Mycoplasma zalophidermidis]
MLTIYQNENVNAVAIELDIYKFKNEIDTLKKEFEENISKLKMKENYGLINYSLFTIQRKSQSVFTAEGKYDINHFVDQNDFNKISNKIDICFKSWYDFHNAIGGSINYVIDLLQKADPLWYAADALGNNLSHLNIDSIPELQVALQGGVLVCTLLGQLQNLKEYNSYSKAFVIQIFGKLTNIAESKDIILIMNSLEEAQRALNNVTSKWNNFISLKISKSKVNRVYDTVKTIYEIAYEKLMEYNRDIMWGTTCY